MGRATWSAVGSGPLTGGLESASDRECRGDHGRRNGHAHGGRPCEGSSREHDGGWGFDGEESVPGDGRGHGRSRIATKRKEECEPTVTMLDAYTRRESV